MPSRRRGGASTSARSAPPSRPTTGRCRRSSPPCSTAAFGHGATNVRLSVERVDPDAVRRPPRSRRPRAHPLIAAVKPVVDAVGATLVPPQRQGAGRRPARLGRRDGGRRAHAAAARCARPADRVGRGRARRQARRACLARRSRRRSASSTSAERSSSAAPWRTSPTRWASAGSPSTTTSTRSTSDTRRGPRRPPSIR